MEGATETGKGGLSGAKEHVGRILESTGESIKSFFADQIPDTSASRLNSGIFVDTIKGILQGEKKQQKYIWHQPDLKESPLDSAGNSIWPYVSNLVVPIRVLYEKGADVYSITVSDRSQKIKAWVNQNKGRFGLTTEGKFNFVHFQRMYLTEQEEEYRRDELNFATELVKFFNTVQTPEVK